MPHTNMAHSAHWHKNEKLGSYSIARSLQARKRHTHTQQEKICPSSASAITRASSYNIRKNFYIISSTSKEKKKRGQRKRNQVCKTRVVVVWDGKIIFYGCIHLPFVHYSKEMKLICIIFPLWNLCLICLLCFRVQSEISFPHFTLLWFSVCLPNPSNPNHPTWMLGWSRRLPSKGRHCINNMSVCPCKWVTFFSRRVTFSDKENNEYTYIMQSLTMHWKGHVCVYPIANRYKLWTFSPWPCSRFYVANFIKFPHYINACNLNSGCILIEIRLFIK